MVRCPHCPQLIKWLSEHGTFHLQHIWTDPQLILSQVNEHRNNNHSPLRAHTGNLGTWPIRRKQGTHYSSCKYTYVCVAFLPPIPWFLSHTSCITNQHKGHLEFAPSMTSSIGPLSKGHPILSPILGVWETHSQTQELQSMACLSRLLYVLIRTCL